MLIGGGTGLAPFISYSLYLKAIGSKREIIVLHGASYVDELSYRDLLTELENESIDKGKDNWNFRYRASISSLKNGSTGHGVDKKEESKHFLDL